MSLNADQALARALAEAFAAHGAQVVIEDVTSRAWASMTFSGRRHVVALRLTGPQAAGTADAVLLDLGDREFAIPGQVLIDIACDAETRSGDQVQLTLSALTVEAD